MKRNMFVEFLLVPQRNEAANYVVCFGLWLISKNCVTGKEARLRELMVQYHIEIKKVKDIDAYERLVIPERLRGRVIGALTR